MTSIGLLGTKIGMTQIFNNTGIAIPVTIVRLGPCSITQIKTEANNGYNAIQIGYLEVNKHKLTRAQLGHLKKANVQPVKYLKEYKNNLCNQFKIGQQLNVQEFAVGDLVDVSGQSIGKGFAGHQKRHNFTRGPMSHGSKNHRQPGSISAGTTPGRVFPGKKMAGRMGCNKITIKNLQIIDINSEDNLVLIKGSIPGKPGNIISIKKQYNDN